MMSDSFKMYKMSQFSSTYDTENFIIGIDNNVSFYRDPSH